MDYNAAVRHIKRRIGSVADGPPRQRLAIEQRCKPCLARVLSLSRRRERRRGRCSRCDKELSPFHFLEYIEANSTRVLFQCDSLVPARSLKIRAIQQARELVRHLLGFLARA